MKRKIQEKLRAIELREQGYSINEIVSKTNVAKSSVSGWVRNVPLTSEARNRLLTKVKLGQIVSAENKRRKTQEMLDAYFHEALDKVSGRTLDTDIKGVICSLLYWCEGAKNPYSGVYFVNSDPKLIKLFLSLFRESFSIDETKFRACVHLHEYHDADRQIRFWSKITALPPHQFMRPYLKPNTRKRIRKDYPGCIAIRYHSNDMARRLLSTAKAFLSLYQDSE